MKVFTVALVLFVGLFFVLSQAKLVPTPFGLRPEICVTRNVPSGSFIEEVEDGVLIHLPTGLKNKLPKHQECLDYHAEWMKNQTQRGFKGQEVNGWLDYCSWYPPSADEVYSFTATYTVPNNPAVNSNQVLFYFIGSQNNGGSDVSILQPVLTWGNGLSGWSYASWNCCPAGQQQESTPIQGFGAGATLTGGIQASGSNWIVTSTYNGKSTTLNVPDASRDFNWVDVTLETYNVATCSEFATGPMTFSNMVLTIDNAGVVTVPWGKNTGATECGGVLNIISSSEVTITHN